MSPGKIHGTQAWRRLSKQVIAEEPLCQLRLDGCTRISTTADHIYPVSIRPDLAYVRAFCIGSCRSCNCRRGNTPISQLDHMRSATTQSDTANSGVPQQHSARALAFFKKPANTNTAPTSAPVFSRNETPPRVSRGVAVCTGLVNTNQSGAQQLSVDELQCDTTILGR